MRTRLLSVTGLVLTLTFIGFAADDPLTGKWRQMPSYPMQMVIAPGSNGFSMQRDEEAPSINKWGSDNHNDDGTMSDIARVDNHTLKSTISQNGTVTGTQTGRVSPDGKRYTWIWEREGITGATSLEYERIGPVPAGDSFYGTWKIIPTPPNPNESGPLTYMIKVDGDAYDIAINSRGFNGQIMPSWKGKLDGKQYKGPEGLEGHSITQARRIDAQTIEVKQTFTSLPQIVLLQNGIFQCSGYLCTPEIKIRGDGKDHPAQRSETYNTESVRVVDDRTIEFTDKKDGKVVSFEKDTVTADGEMTTAEVTSYPADGKQPVTSKTIWRRIAPGPSGSHAVSGTWELSSNYEATTQWQVKGNTLTRATRMQSNQGGQNQSSSSVQRFERID